jgi:hypothetical protein
MPPTDCFMIQQVYGASQPDRPSPLQMIKAKGEKND